MFFLTLAAGVLTLPAAFVSDDASCLQHRNFELVEEPGISEHEVGHTEVILPAVKDVAHTHSDQVHTNVPRSASNITALLLQQRRAAYRRKMQKVVRQTLIEMHAEFQRRAWTILFGASGVAMLFAACSRLRQSHWDAAQALYAQKEALRQRQVDVLEALKPECLTASRGCSACAILADLQNVGHGVLRSFEDISSVVPKSEARSQTTGSDAIGRLVSAWEEREGHRSEVPAFQCQIPGIDVGRVRQEFEANGGRVMLEASELATRPLELESSPWQASVEAPGCNTCHFGFSCRFEDSPTWASGVESSDQQMKISFKCTMASGNDETELVVMRDCHFHGVAWDEHLIGSDLMTFKPHPQGGSQFYVWPSVVRLKAAQWDQQGLMRQVRGKLLEMARSDGAVLAKLIVERC